MLLLLVQGSILRSRDGSVSEDARDERNMSLFRAPAQGLKRRGMSGVPRPSGISEVDPMDLLPDPASGRLGARRPLSHHGVMSFFPRGPPAPAAPGAAAEPPAQRVRNLSGRRLFGGAGVGGPTDSGLALALGAKLDALALRIRTVDARSQLLQMRQQDEVAARCRRPGAIAESESERDREIEIDRYRERQTDRQRQRERERGRDGSLQLARLN